MKRKTILIACLILTPLILIISGIIGALLRLINLQAIVITILILIFFIRKTKSKLLKKILRFFYYNNNNRYLYTKQLGSKKEAAQKSLGSIQKLIDQIQYDVASRGLRQEKERVEKEFSRGDLEVVVFGTGSSGKTSLIRALLKKIVGNVGPSMGSTTGHNSYRLLLKGLPRAIQIFDTPGILESGEKGNQRQKESILKASRSDLIIVVVDADLRETEFNIIQDLIKTGKRIILVLNKKDLLGIEEEKKLLTKLRSRMINLIDPENIIATTASPQTIPQPGAYPIQPPPQIELLITRLANILYKEGEELMAENILMQCRNLSEYGRDILNAQRKKHSIKTIDKYTWLSSGVVAITPLPGSEYLGTAAVNAQMVMEIGNAYGIKLTKQRAKDLALSVAKTLAGLGVVQGGMNIIGATMSTSIPGIIISKTIQGITAGWLTRVAGYSFITFFQQNQDWGDGGIQEVVLLQYDLNKKEESLRRFVKETFKRITELQTQKKQRELPPRQMLQEEEESSDL